MTHILIVNQHGENRGDEAAMRAMLASFDEQVPDCTFTLLYQFRDRSLRLNFHEDVEDLPIVLPVLDYVRGLAFTALKFFGLDAHWVLPHTLKKIIAAYEHADLVVSAPGGPYFGDHYINHEIIHWWYIYLAKLFEKPLFLYATSAGPFKHPIMNRIRRWLYSQFGQLVTREEISAAFIEELMVGSAKVEVTADSAIQAVIEPLARDTYFTGKRSALATRFVVAVSLLDFRYPKSDNVAESKRRYNDAMTEILTHIVNKMNAHFLFLPQLYGKVHSDVPYLETMGKQLPEGASWEIVSPHLDSDTQRAIFAMSDLYIASRYHPAIFGSTAFLPGLCIYYEHKALGFMAQLGLERYAFDINHVDGESLCAAIDDILKHRISIVAHLRKIVPKLQERSARTTELAIKLLTDNSSAK